MALGGRLIEKPDGARNVEMWDVHVERSYALEHVMVPDGRDSYRIETRYQDDPAIVWLKIGVKFFDDQSAQDFENKVRAMLPEVGP